VKAIASDALVPPGKVLASPTLLHNVTKGIFNPPSSQIAQLAFRSSPFGSRRPSIPVARGITVARIASPASMDRANEATFLRALKTYLSHTVHLVKEGDIIALTIDTNDKHAVWSNEVGEAAHGEDVSMPQ